MSVTERLDGRTAGVGFGAGLAAFVTGYLVTYLLQRDSVEETLQSVNFVLELFGNEPIPPERAVGWLFYNAHFVDVRMPGLVGERTVNFIANGEGSSLAVLYVVPPLLLLGAGLLVAWYAAAASPLEGAVAGALVAAGYLPAVIGGRMAVTYTVGDGAVAPEAATAVLLAGLAYPLVFGALGGAVTGAIATRTSGTRD